MALGFQDAIDEEPEPKPKSTEVPKPGDFSWALPAPGSVQKPPQKTLGFANLLEDQEPERLKTGDEWRQVAQAETIPEAKVQIEDEVAPAADRVEAAQPKLGFADLIKGEKAEEPERGVFSRIADIFRRPAGVGPESINIGPTAGYKGPALKQPPGSPEERAQAELMERQAEVDVREKMRQVRAPGPAPKKKPEPSRGLLSPNIVPEPQLSAARIQQPGDVEEPAAPPWEQPKRGVLEKGLEAAGLLDAEAVAQRRRQRAAAESTISLLAKEQGVSVPDYRNPSPRVLGQALTAYADMSTFGIGGALLRAYGFDADAPETTAEQIAHGVGALAGFIGLGGPLARLTQAARTPAEVETAVNLGMHGEVLSRSTQGPADFGQIFRGVGGSSPVLGLAEMTVERAIQQHLADYVANTGAPGAVLAATVAKQMATLSIAQTAAATGEALGQQDLLEAAKVYGRAAKDGAVMGAIFGGAGTLMPGETLLQRVARMGIGMAALDASQGQHPLDDRPLAQKAFDYGLNAYFLFRGVAPENFNRTMATLDYEASRLGTSFDEVFKHVVDAKAAAGAEKFQQVYDVFRRRGYSHMDAADRAAQTILQNRPITQPPAPDAPARDAAARESDAVKAAMENLAAPVESFIPQSDIKLQRDRQTGDIVVSDKGQEIDRIPAAPQSQPERQSDYLTGLDEVLGPEPKSPGAEAIARRKGGPAGEYPNATESMDDLAVRIAQEYDAAQTDPAAKPAWDALAADVDRAYDEIVKRVQVEKVTGQPYANSDEMLADIRSGHFKVTTDNSEHPFWSVEQNWKFRVVHDYVGHFLSGASFDLEGERAAFQHHAKYVADPLARLALQNEVFGQAASAIGNGGVFPEQKAFLPKNLVPVPPPEQLFEPTPPQRSAVEYLSGLEDLFGEQGSSLAQEIKDAEARLKSQPDITRRGVDLRGTIGEEGWQKNKKLVNDLAAAGAGEIWRGDKTFKSWSEQMLKNWGPEIEPELKKIFKLSQDKLKDLQLKVGRMPTVEKALKLFHAGGIATPESYDLNPAFWYDNALPEIQKAYGRHADIYISFLAATSPHNEVSANVEMANKALKMYLTGERSRAVPFVAGWTPESIKDGIKKAQAAKLEGREYVIPNSAIGRMSPDDALEYWSKQKVGDGFMEAHAGNLNRALNGKELSGPKVGAFRRALAGDRHAVVVDTWMLRAFGLSGDASDFKVRLIQAIVSRMAREFGMDERQVQAQIWAGVRRLWTETEKENIPDWVSKDAGGFVDYSKLKNMNKSKNPPIDVAIMEKLGQIQEYLLTAGPEATRRIADGGPTLTERLAEIVARGKAAGFAPDQMFKDFTGRGADAAVSLAAIQRHFPDFKGAANVAAQATQAAPGISAPAKVVGGPAAPPVGRIEGAPQPQPQGPVGQPVAPGQPVPGAAGGRPAVRVRKPRLGAKPVPAAQPVAGAQPVAAPAAPAAVGHGVAEGRANIPGPVGVATPQPRIRTVFPRGGASPQPDARVQPYLAVLQEGGQHQVDDFTRGIQALDTVGGFGLFNGAGTGKTYVLLSLLDAKRREGNSVYYVAPASVLQVNLKTGEPSGTIKEAAERLGVPVKVWDGIGRPSEPVIHVMTYEKFKKLPPDTQAVIVFDEAHFLKNVETGGPESRAARGGEWMRQAKGVVLATATPLDKASHLPYLERLGVFEGKTKAQAMLGLGVIQREGRNGELFWQPTTVTPKRIRELFERLADRGLLSSRYITMEGAEVFLKRVQIDEPAVNRMIGAILKGHGVEDSAELRGMMKAKVLGDIVRQLEPYKVEPAAELAIKELGEGRQVIFYISRINYSAARTPKRLGYNVILGSEGTAKILKERLAAAGITEVGELHGNAEEKRFDVVRDFQSGKTKVLIATPESGAQGLNLDDQVGNVPRTTILITTPYGATEIVQAAGRTLRLNTKSHPRYYFFDSGVDMADGRINRIGVAKLRMLGATVQGDVEQKLGQPEITQRPAEEGGLELRAHDAEAYLEDRFGTLRPRETKYELAFIGRKGDLYRDDGDHNGTAKQLIEDLWPDVQDTYDHPAEKLQSLTGLVRAFHIDDEVGVSVVRQPTEKQMQAIRGLAARSRVPFKFDINLVSGKVLEVGDNLADFEDAVRRHFGGPEITRRAAPEPRSVAFVSPNTEANLDYQRSLERLSSEEHQLARREAEVLARELGLDATHHDMVGYWHGGAENSIVSFFRPGSDYDAIRYLAALRGALNSQREVLTFQPGAGDDRLYNLTLDMPGPEARALLEQHGIDSLSMQEHGDLTNALIVDQGNQLRETMERLEALPNVDIEYERGRGDSIGEAQYPEVFKVYEAAHEGSQGWGARSLRRGEVRRAESVPEITRRAEEVEREHRDTLSTGAFRRWFRNSKVVDEDGRPLVVYHGTTHDFKQFGPQLLNTDSAFGAAYYFTSSPEDAGRNYAGIGPAGHSRMGQGFGADLVSRIELLAEQLEQEEGIQSHEAMRRAREELYGGAPNIMPVYLSLRNPVELQKNGGTRFTIRSNEDGTREWGNGVKLFDALHEELPATGDEVWNYLVRKIDFDDTPAVEVLEVLGEEIPPESLRSIIERMGYDGVIMRDADERYKYMFMGDEPVTHYLAFRPNQIKSAYGNRGTFSMRSPDITRRTDEEETRPAPGPMFFSTVERALESPKVPNRAPAEQLLNTLKKMPGVKGDELKWLGLDDEWVKRQVAPISKAELADWVRDRFHGTLEPNVLIAGGPAQPVSIPEIPEIPTYLREAVLRADVKYESANRDLLDFRQNLEDILVKKFERQNEIAKARKRKGRVPKEQALPGWESDQTTEGLKVGIFKGQPGPSIAAVSGLDITGGGWRRRLGPVEWGLTTDYEHSRWVITRGGDPVESIPFTGNDLDDARRRLKELSSQELPASQEKRWKVNPMTEAREIIDSLFSKEGFSTPAFGETHRPIYVIEAQRIAQGLLGQDLKEVWEKLNQLTADLSTAQNRLDDAQKDLRAAERKREQAIDASRPEGRPETQYAKYVPVVFPEYGEASFVQKKPAEIAKLQARSDEIAAALDKLSHEITPDFYGKTGYEIAPSGYEIRSREEKIEPLITERIEEPGRGRLYDARGSDGGFMRGFTTREAAEGWLQRHQLGISRGDYLESKGLWYGFEPEGRGPVTNFYERREDALNATWAEAWQQDQNRRYDVLTAERREITNQIETLDQGGGFQTPHFDRIKIPGFRENQLFHVRFAMAPLPDGGKALVLHEIQSDRGIKLGQELDNIRRQLKLEPATPEWNAMTYDRVKAIGPELQAEIDKLKSTRERLNRLMLSEWPELPGIARTGTWWAYDPRTGEIAGRFEDQDDVESFVANVMPEHGLYRFNWNLSDDVKEVALNLIKTKINRLLEVQINIKHELPPDAPFIRGSYDEAAVKWAMRYALENGANAVVWPTGPQVNKIYNVGQYVESLMWLPGGSPEEQLARLEWEKVVPRTFVGRGPANAIGREGTEVGRAFSGANVGFITELATDKWEPRVQAQDPTGGLMWRTGPLLRREEAIEWIEQNRPGQHAGPDYGNLVYTPKGGGNPVDIPGDIKISDLPRHVGKEVAQRLLAAPGTEITGEDLSYGGPAHRTHYDEKLPNIVNKLIKRLGGGQVELTTVGGPGEVGFDYNSRMPDEIMMTGPEANGRWYLRFRTHSREMLLGHNRAETAILEAGFPDQLSARRFYWDHYQPETVAAANARQLRMHGFRITPEMGQQIMAGQPLFRPSGHAEPVWGDVKEAMKYQKSIPGDGPFMDSNLALPPSERARLANRQYLQDLMPVWQRLFYDFADQLGHQNTEWLATDSNLSSDGATYHHRDPLTREIMNQDVRFSPWAHVKHVADMMEKKGRTDDIGVVRAFANQIVETIIHELAHHRQDLESNGDHGPKHKAERRRIIRVIGRDKISQAIREVRAILRRPGHLDAFLDDIQGLLGGGFPAVTAGYYERLVALERQWKGEGNGPEITSRPSGQDTGGVGGAGEVVRAAGDTLRPEDEIQVRQRPATPEPGGREAAEPGGTGEAEALDWQTEAARETLEYFAGRTMAPPPAYTLGGGTVTRPHTPNIIQRLRKDKIIQEFSQALRDLGKGGLTVQGGIFQPGALGQSHRQSGNVRLRYITDIDAAAHEFGHRLQDALGVRNPDLQPFLGELAAIQSATGAQGATVAEGWADFWRLHATDPLTVARVAPQLYRWAEARMRQEPAVDAAWQAFRNQTMELRAQSPVGRVKSIIATPEKEPALKRAREVIAVGHLRSLLRNNLFAYFDRTLPFRLVTEAAEASLGRALPASRDPFKWSRTMSSRVIDALNGFRTEGVQDWNTRRPIPGTKSFEDIVRAVAGQQEDFQAYEVLARARFLAGSTRPDGSPNEVHRSTAAHLMRMADIDAAARDQAIAQLEQQYPHFQGVLDDLQSWNVGLLRWMRDSGAYSQETIDRIQQANDLYVPLHRLMDDPKAGAHGTSGESTVNVGRAIKRLGGRSERMILPTLQTRIRQALLMLGTAERNYTGRILFDAVQQIPNYGVLADKVPTPVKATQFQLDDLKGTLKRAFAQSGQNPGVLDLVDLDVLARVFQPNMKDMPNDHVVIWRNGEPEVWQIHDPLLLKAVTTMGPNEARAFGQAMGLMGSFLYRLAKIPAKFVQFNVVHGIDFLVGHLVRSAQEQGLQGYLLPPVIRGARDIATGGIAKERYVAGGGRVFNFESYSPEGIQRQLERLTYTTRNPFALDYWQEGGIRRAGRDLLSVLDMASRIFDEPARVGVAKLALDNPRAVDTTELDQIVEAAFRGRESGLDFSQRGASDLFNRFLSLIPFSHAVATGLYRNLRNYRQGAQAIGNEGLAAAFRTTAGHPERRYARGLLIYGAAMLLAALYNVWANQNDPRYRALTDQEKTGYFHFLPPWSRRFTPEEWNAMSPDERLRYADPYIKVSKPWWPGFFQATLPAEIFEGITREEQTLGQTLGKIWASFLQSSRIDVLPTVAKVPLEIRVNRQGVLAVGDTMHPINPDYQLKLEPEKRYGPDTPEVAKKFSAMLRSVPGFDQMSPRDVQYLVRSMGYLPQYGMNMAEWVDRTFSGRDMPEPPAKRWNEIVGVQRFSQRFPTSHPQVVNDLDVIYRKSQEIAATYQRKVKDRDEDLQEYRDRHIVEIAEAPVAALWAKQMREMWKQADRIKAQKDMTAEEKRNRIDLLYLDVLDQSNRFMSRMQEVRRDRIENP